MDGATPLATAAAAPANSAPTPGAMQAELETVVTEAGYTINEFKKWGEDSGNVPDADSLANFGEIHDVVARRLIRSKAGIIAGLNRMFPKS